MNFTLPTSTAVDIGGQVTDNFSSVSPIVIPLIAIILAFIIIDIIIDSIRGRGSKY